MREPMTKPCVSLFNGFEAGGGSLGASGPLEHDPNGPHSEL